MARRLGRAEVAKYHGLGNDYLALDAARFGVRLTPARIRALCDRHRGVGADGIVALVSARRGRFGVRIYNPDGSEAEKSGNGLRIFARFLFEHGYTKRTELVLATRNESIPATLRLRGGRVHRIRLAMGRADFASQRVPVTGPPREVLNEAFRLGPHELRISCVSLGNPHCVVFRDRLHRDELLELGPALENDPRFPRRINVQLAQVESRRLVRALVWERGAGETQASGSSACAVAAAAHRLGLVDASVTIELPGGALRVRVGPDFGVVLTGPAEPVFRARVLQLQGLAAE